MPWALATSEDARYPSVGGRELKTRLPHGYMDQVLALATERIAVRPALLEVQHMLQPPTTLFRPSIVGSVLMHVLDTRRRPSAMLEARRA